MNVIPLLKKLFSLNLFATNKLLPLTSIFVAIFCSCIFSSWTAFASPKTTGPAKRQVIFLPFVVEIPGPYAYLRNGLASMLASRLASRADIDAISQGEATEQMAKALKSGEFAAFSQLLRKSGADYLIMSSFAPKGERFELTSYVFTNNSGETPKRFQHDVAVIDDAMTAIDDLAWDISGAVFGNPKPEELASGSKQATGATAFQTAHPERAYRESLLATGTASGLEPGGQFELTGSYRSKNIPYELMDMNAGDLDGDGKDEVVLLSKSSLIIYRHMEGQFQMVATIDLPTHIRYLSVTMADLNKNGHQEIYISGSNGDLPDSSALEWDGKKITYLFQHVPFYLRTMAVPHKPAILLGQKALSGEEVGYGDIYQMALDPRNGVTMDKKLTLPQGLNVFDFVQADLKGDGSLETIAINDNNRLQVFDASGALLWTSKEQYGASNNYFGTPSSNFLPEGKKTVYTKTRIVIADLNQDGVNDVLVGRNRLETVKFMPNLRYFDGSSITALKWEKGALTPLFETRKIPGYMTNYQILPSEKGTNSFQILFTEGTSTYPFIFWESPSAFINSYTLRHNRP